MTTIKVVIETPKGSAQKYNYDPESHFFELGKMLPAGMVFPYDFGFIPHTTGEDGDPLDVIVISEFHSFPGCLMSCRVIGAIVAKQSADKHSKKMIRNDRFLAIPESSGIFSTFQSVQDLPPHIIRELEMFFRNYNELKGKKFSIEEVVKAQKAFDMIGKWRQ